MNTSLTKKILFDYFDGKRTSMQYKMIGEWLKIKENQELFYQYLDEWESQNPQYLFDIKKGSSTITERMEVTKADENIDTIEEEISFHSNYKWLAAAAVLLIFSWIGLTQLTKTKAVSYKQLVNETKKYTGEIYEKENLTSQPLFISLPDESSIILQPQSKISYSPQQYNKTKREVILSGEAFFEVHKNPDVPFFVYANDLITKVLGTSFTIKTNPIETEVIVKTGRVSVIMQNDVHKNEKLNGKTLEGFVLGANEQVRINQNSERIEKAIIVRQEALLQPIQKLSFDFDETPATEIIDVIKNAYHVEISYDKGKLSSCKLTARLSDQPLIEKIKLICIALDANYNETDKGFVIQSNGCK